MSSAADLYPSRQASKLETVLFQAFCSAARPAAFVGVIAVADMVSAGIGHPLQLTQHAIPASLLLHLKPLRDAFVNDPNKIKNEPYLYTRVNTDGSVTYKGRGPSLETIYHDKGARIMGVASVAIGHAATVLLPHLA